MAGRLLAIFFKRRFSFKVSTRKDVLDVLPVFLASFVIRFGLVGLVLGLGALLYSNYKHINDEMVKTIALSVSIHAAVYTDWDENTFACLALAFATTQFLRKPDKLKQWLREPRVICGPVYVILICAGLRFCSTEQLSLTSGTTGIAALCSILAGVFFRPDNNETLKLFVPQSKIPTTSQRQVAHGVLLFAGFLLTFLKVALLNDQPWIDATHKEYKVAAAGVGVLNILLYLYYKKSRGWR